MKYKVVVVGGGIGGLTVAALLAARGVEVCLLERQSQVGGCVASFEKFGYAFEPTFGIYDGWGTGGIHQQIFSELEIDPPETRIVRPAFSLRGEEQESTKAFIDWTAQELVAIRGGAASLAERLAESIKRSGGSVRLNTPVLRLSYDSMGNATGVDLLNGENVTASQAIVSNLTLWDNYGKMIGLQRTPAEIKKQLAALRGTGVYMIFAGVEESAVATLPSDRILVSTNEPTDPESLIDVSLFVFASAPSWDPRGVENKRAATITFRAEVDEWFTYQADISEQEEKDQAALEQAWKLLHKHLPELGGGIEVIETATPQTYYDTTRRKLGMVCTPTHSSSTHDLKLTGYRTPLRNVFIVSDTVSAFPSLAAVSETALRIANELQR